MRQAGRADDAHHPLDLETEEGIVEPLQVVDGAIVIPDRPGNGLAWDMDAVESYRIV